MGDAAPTSEPQVVAGRSCGTCTLCCKVIAVDSLGKAPGTWCAHCQRNKGCAIYETRPDECRDFYCHWMVEKGLGPDWKPERARFALVTSQSGITAFVDPGFAGAWRGAPYYQTLKRWSLDGVRQSPARLVTIRIGTRAIIVLPDREIDLGVVGPRDSFRLESSPDGSITVKKSTPAGASGEPPP